MAREVLAPDGVRWTLRRHWMPRFQGLGFRERWKSKRARSSKRERDKDSSWFDWLDLPMDGLDLLDDGPGCLIGIGVAVFILVLVVLSPVFLAVLDVVFVGVLAILGIGGRVVFRRPWTVEARSSDGRVEEHKVVGWQQSGVAIDAWARAIEAGRVQPPRPARGSTAI